MPAKWFLFLGLLEPPRDAFSVLLSSLSLPCTPDPMKGLSMDLSSAERMSIGDELSASASWKKVNVCRSKSPGDRSGACKHV